MIELAVALAAIALLVGLLNARAFRSVMDSHGERLRALREDVTALRKLLVDDIVPRLGGVRSDMDWAYDVLRGEGDHDVPPAFVEIHRLRTLVVDRVLRVETLCSRVNDQVQLMRAHLGDASRLSATVDVQPDKDAHGARVHAEGSTTEQLSGMDQTIREALGALGADLAAGADPAEAMKAQPGIEDLYETLPPPSGSFVDKPHRKAAAIEADLRKQGRLGNLVTREDFDRRPHRGNPRGF